MLRPPSLLEVCELTAAERAAQDTAPRPGIWAGDELADLRRLSQDETDLLIRHELARYAFNDPELLSVLGGPLAAPGVAKLQRGGLDSDPLVRVLARRAWRDRDERWFELRGLRVGDELSLSEWHEPSKGECVRRRWQHEQLYAIATHDARPGDRALCQLVELGRPSARTASHLVSDRLRVGKHPAARRYPF